MAEIVTQVRVVGGPADEQHLALRSSTDQIGHTRDLVIGGVTHRYRYVRNQETREATLEYEGQV